MRVAGRSISRCLPCPVPSWVPNILINCVDDSIITYCNHMLDKLHSLLIDNVYDISTLRLTHVIADVIADVTADVMHVTSRSRRHHEHLLAAAGCAPDERQRVAGAQRRGKATPNASHCT